MVRFIDVHGIGRVEVGTAALSVILQNEITGGGYAVGRRVYSIEKRCQEMIDNGEMYWLFERSPNFFELRGRE